MTTTRGYGLMFAQRYEPKSRIHRGRGASSSSEVRICRGVPTKNPSLGRLIGGAMNNAFTNPGSTSARFITVVTTLIGSEPS